MLEVLSAVTGESIAFFEEMDFAEGSVKALKQRLAQKIGIPRFRLRLLRDNSPLDDQTLIDNHTLSLQVVQLVILEFQLPDREQDQSIMVACEENDDKLLEQHLNQPRNPNFKDANERTPLFAASITRSLKCVSLLIEAGARQRPSRRGWWSNASVRSISSRAPWSCPISGWVRCQRRPRHDGWWSNASLHSSLSGAAWSCPISGWVRCQQRPRHHRKWSNTSIQSSSGGGAWSCPISGRLRCQQRSSHHRWWSNASLHSSWGRAPRSCPISGWVRCQHRPRHDGWWNDAAVHSSCRGAPWKLSYFWLRLVPTKTKARQI